MLKRGRAGVAALVVGLLLGGLGACGQEVKAPARPGGNRPASVKERSARAGLPIDLEHILQGRVNSQGQLVGVHHAPSAPKTMRVDGRECRLEIEWTSPGTERDVRTGRVRLRDPRTREVVLEKFSTFYPSAWDRSRIEAGIREAYGEAKGRGQVESNGRWQGRTKDGVRIDGYLRYDGKGIATAFPVYTPGRDTTRRPR